MVLLSTEKYTILYILEFPRHLYLVNVYAMFANCNEGILYVFTETDLDKRHQNEPCTLL